MSVSFAQLKDSIVDLTFCLTQQCNITCPYCYQNRRPISLSFSHIQNALDFFQHAFHEGCFIDFYGGEPLLAMDTIQQTVSYIRTHKVLRTKKLRYCLSTNGTLLTEEIRQFLNTHSFRIFLSHDGTAQDLTRPSPWNSFVLENMDRLSKTPNIAFSTNSVFTPATTRELLRSVKFFIEKGIRNCHLAYSINDSWAPVYLDQMREEVKELSEYLQSYYRSYGVIPVLNFRSRPLRTLFWCPAGQDRFSVGPDGKVWGCRLFSDFFLDKETLPAYNEYCLRAIKDFGPGEGASSSSMVRNYGNLRMDKFFTERQACLECSRLLDCDSCPASAAFATGLIGKIPAWTCEMKNIWHKEVTQFWKEADKS